MEKRTLFEITGDLIKLDAMMEDGEEDLEAYFDTHEGLFAEFEDKVDDYGYLIKNVSAKIDAIKAEEKRLAERRKVLENNVNRVKDRLMQCMVAAETKRVNGTFFTFTVRKPGVKLPEGLTFEDVPEEYRIPQDPKVDGKKLTEDIKSGKFTGIALVPGKVSLLIK